MDIGSALRRKCDEIAATIAAYEARLEAARMDLVALEQAGRLFDSEPDETTIPHAMSQAALRLVRAKRLDDQDASLSESFGLREGQVKRPVAHSDTQKAGEPIPGGLFI